MSTVTLSQPHWAMTSAEKPDGIASQPFTAAFPAAIRALSLFAIWVVPPGCQNGAQASVLIGPEVRKAADLSTANFRTDKDTGKALSSGVVHGSEVHDGG